VSDDGYLDDIAAREGKAEQLKRVLIALTFLTSVIALVFLVWVVILIRNTQTANSPLVQQALIQTSEIKALAEQIDSCVDQTATDGDPKGQCAKEGQRSQGEAIASINVITLYAAVCGPLVTPEQPLDVRLSIIRTCVANLTQQHQP
jgi:cytoskeletal protein RodZ